MKVTIALIIAIILQWTLRNVAEPLAYVDFPLIVVVYAALQRNSIRAIIVGTIAGLSMDALSGGLLGANGFSKTLIAYIVSEAARRVYLDNLLLRIPVVAAACVLDDLVYYGMHNLLGQEIAGQVLITMSYSLLATTIAGTVSYIILEYATPDKVSRKRGDFFGPRRQTRRRNPIRLGRR